MQYETEKKEQQIAMQGIRIEKNKSIQRLLILAFILASTLAFFFLGGTELRSETTNSWPSKKE
jgi:hypothetical protein